MKRSTQEESSCNQRTQNYLDLQLREACSTFRAQYTLLVTLVLGLVTSNITLAAAAFHLGSSGLFACAAFVAGVILAIEHGSRQLMLPIIITGLYADRRLAKLAGEEESPGSKGIVFIYISSLLPADAMSALCARTSDMELVQARPGQPVIASTKIKMPSLSPGYHIWMPCVIIVMVLEIVMAVAYLPFWGPCSHS